MDEEKKQEEEEIIWEPERLEDYPPFVGTIVSAEWEPNPKFGGKQLHIQIKPDDIDIKGATGTLHEWYTYSKYRSSKWGVFVEHLRAVGFVGTESKLVNQRFVFQKKRVTINRRQVEVILPIAPAEKAKELLTEEGIEEAIENNEQPQQATADQITIDEKRFETLKDILRKTGLTEAQIKKWAQREGITTRELEAWLQTHQNELSVDEDGTITMK